MAFPDFQFRGPGTQFPADKKEWAVGDGIAGGTLAVSGGMQGIQVEGMLSAIGLGVKVSYSSGWTSTSDNITIQFGFAGVIGGGEGVAVFAGGGWSWQDGWIQSASVEFTAVARLEECFGHPGKPGSRFEKPAISTDHGLGSGD
jgi:hypothetical protein